MDVFEAIHGRRSVRSYLPDPVDRDLVEQIIWDAAQAPPPFQGEVPWTFSVVRGVERIAALGARAMDYAISHRRALQGDAGWLERPGFKIFWDAPALIVISGNEQDCCRAGQNLMLSAHARGLGTCWVGSPMLWLKTDEAKSELGIPAELEPVAVFCLGYPSAMPEAPPKERPPIVWAD